MASSFSPASASCFNSTTVPAVGSCSNQKLNLISNGFHYSSAARFPHLNGKATKNDRNTKPHSVICGDCDGNGAVLCSQCKGSGVNAVDFFNGQFKAGASCWLCGGKKEMLCGNCNGAGFVGGFLSTYDE